MLKKLSIQLFLILPLLCAVSCSKSKVPELGVSPFVVDGTGYDTLQEAVDATKNAAEAVITLQRNAMGEGAVISGDVAASITIDLQSFTYKLQSGSSINVDGQYVVITGDGGLLHSTDAKPVLSVTDAGEAIIAGNFSILADEAIYADDSFVRVSKFSGYIEGNMLLNSAQFLLTDAGCVIITDRLEVRGEDAEFSADTEPDGSRQAVTIGKVVSELKYPVTSTVEGVIGVRDGSVHIHNLISKHIPGTCITPDVIYYCCTECGYESYEPMESMGTCPKDELIYHPAKAATDIECGNVEYWECPLCGKSYSNKNGTEEILDGTVILPKSYFLGDSLIFNNDFYLDWDTVQEENSLPVISLIIGCMSFTNGLYGTISKLVSDDAEKWKTTFKKLDEIKGKLDVIDKKIDQIQKEIQELPCKVQISERNARLSAMKYRTLYTDSLICKYLNDPSLTTDKKTQYIKDAVKHWASSVYEGMTFVDLTKSMMQQYHTGYLSQNFPMMWESYVNGLCPWEHLGYNFRHQIILNDIAYLSVAWGLTLLYYNDIKEYSNPDLRKMDTDELKRIRDIYNADCNSILKRMKDRQRDIRRFNPAGISYNYWSTNTYASEVFSALYANKDWRFPRNNDDNKAVDSCNKLMSHLGFNHYKYMTAAQARQIRDVYNKGHKENRSLYWVLSNNYVGLMGHVDQYKGSYFGSTYIILAQDDSNFGHFDGNNARPKYKMWAWEVWGGKFDSDMFGFQSCLKDDATTCVDKVLEDCNIKTYGSKKGKITGWGKTTHYTFTKFQIVEN